MKPYQIWPNRPIANTPNNPICQAWRCSAVARTTYVDQIGGQQQRLCRRHLLEAERQEQVNHVRVNLAALFRSFCPWVFGLRGAILAPIGVGGRAAI